MRAFFSFAVCLSLTNGVSVGHVEQMLTASDDSEFLVDSEVSVEGYDGGPGNLNSSQILDLHQFLSSGEVDAKSACRKCRQFEKFGWYGEAMCGYSGFCARRSRRSRARRNRARRNRFFVNRRCRDGNDACSPCKCNPDNGQVNLEFDDASKQCAYGQYSCSECGNGFIMMETSDGLKVCIDAVGNSEKSEPHSVEPENSSSSNSEKSEPHSVEPENSSSSNVECDEPDNSSSPTNKICDDDPASCSACKCNPTINDIMININLPDSSKQCANEQWSCTECGGEYALVTTIEGLKVCVWGLAAPMVFTWPGGR